MFTAEEIEIGKFYKRGNTWHKLLERTGDKVESYPGAFSNVYLFQIIGINNSFVFTETKELRINPEFRCFETFDKQEIEEELETLIKSAEILKTIICSEQ